MAFTDSGGGNQKIANARCILNIVINEENFGLKYFGCDMIFCDFEKILNYAQVLKGSGYHTLRIFIKFM